MHFSALGESFCLTVTVCCFIYGAFYPRVPLEKQTQFKAHFTHTLHYRGMIQIYIFKAVKFHWNKSWRNYQGSKQR